MQTSSSPNKKCSYNKALWNYICTDSSRRSNSSTSSSYVFDIMHMVCYYSNYRVRQRPADLVLVCRGRQMLQRKQQKACLHIHVRDVFLSRASNEKVPLPRPRRRLHDFFFVWFILTLSCFLFPQDETTLEFHGFQDEEIKIFEEKALERRNFISRILGTPQKTTKAKVRD
jgi:hypothetical protein